METPRRRKWLHFAVLLASIVCAGCWASGRVRSMQDRSEVAQMMARTKTVCVGRYLIDVPVEAEVSLSHGMLGGFAVSTTEEGKAEFLRRLVVREAALKAALDTESTRSSGLIESRELRIPDMLGRMFVFGRTISNGFEGGQRVTSEYASIESHVHIRGLSFLLTMQYADDADLKLAEAMLRRLHVQGKDEIASALGFCVPRAVFVEPLPSHDNEYMTMRLRLPNHPDIDLAFSSTVGVKPGPGILSRTLAVDADTRPEELLRVTKLRAGKRNINGLKGEEVLERVREYNLSTTDGFNWEARGREMGSTAPYPSLELQTGIGERPGTEPVAASLHEDALLDLWDSIASSIRARQAAASPALAAH